MRVSRCQLVTARSFHQKNLVTLARVHVGLHFLGDRYAERIATFGNSRNRGPSLLLSLMVWYAPAVVTRACGGCIHGARLTAPLATPVGLSLLPELTDATGQGFANLFNALG